MGFLTATVLSGIVYDTLKCGVMLSTDNLKNKLKDWLIDQPTLLSIESGLNNLSLTDEMSELVIERKIAQSFELKLLLENIKPALESNTIIQSHSGPGDNVGRDKIINKHK
mgnify:CR=1 FL=1